MRIPPFTFFASFVLSFFVLPESFSTFTRFFEAFALLLFGILIHRLQLLGYDRIGRSVLDVRELAQIVLLDIGEKASLNLFLLLAA